METRVGNQVWGKMEWKGRVWRESAGIGGHVVCGVVTQFSGNLSECMKVFLIRTPNNGGYRTGHLLTAGEVSSGVPGLYSGKLLAKQDLWKFSKNPGNSQRILLRFLTSILSF